MGLKQEIEIARDLALEGGRILRRHHSEEIQVGYRRDTGEPITIPELQVDDIIVSGLSNAFPDDVLCSKQTLTSTVRRGAERVWLIEAVDGTRDFIRHGTEASISIGLLVHDRPVLGVVYNPMRHELFTGLMGAGATLNGRRIWTSPGAGSTGMRVSAASDEEPHFRTAAELGIQVSPIASLAYRLARVAAGREDGTCTLMPALEWTTCAGAALVMAAGGRVTTHRGLPLVYNSPNLLHGAGIVAAGAAFHPLLANVASLLTPSTLRPI
jgi:fructose-1,6-bisphosphatase/inositol monophosphatase family enzyme